MSLPRVDSARQEGLQGHAEPDAEALAALIRAAVRQALEQEQLSPWLTAAEAADYMRCPESRIRKLTSARVIPVHHEGRHVLYRRDELEAFIEAGGWSG